MQAQPDSPTPPEPTLPKGEMRRRALLDAALRVIAESGVEAVTHRRVAEAAGVSRGTTTYHFASRDEIVLEAFRHYIATVATKLPTTLDDLLRANEGALLDFLVRFQQREFLDPELILAEYELILYAARNETLGREYRAWESGLLGHLASALEVEGAPRPMRAARLVMGIYRAFELERLTHPETDPEELRSRLQVLLPSLLAPPAEEGRP
jgi:DNA-binding transcriptional regulator YbjK